MSAKEDLLYKSYEILNQIIWYDYPLEEADKVVAHDVMGYGTNIDEKMLNLQGFCKLVKSQRDQGSMEVNLVINPVVRRLFSQENGAVFVDEILFKMLIEGKTIELFLRATWLFEYKNDQWLLIHWHGSVPVAVEGDTWQINLWKKKNDELQLKVDEQTAEIRESLDQLKSTQAQLIQSEKMASLGELTAGIAHEIQNPLNFVNNFSEVNSELIDEMNAALASGDQPTATSLSKDIRQNLEKITYHGKRADAIVKGMLMHSRSSSGIKEPTDMNELCDEYLRLCYHGLRAKDKSFNATMNADFDQTIGNINVIPQDIGRAILNLLTNAFYSVNEKRKTEPASYIPTVSIHTRKKGSSVEIRVIDNGKGISSPIRDKIFQPFFTSKPTGQGTGLGLSLSYDIITKGHGGELKVESIEGRGAEFIILLPSDNQK